MFNKGFFQQFLIRSKNLCLLAIMVISFFVAVPSFADEKIAKQVWSFDGPFGTYDHQSLQRGYQIYKQVCSSCHGLSLLSYRNLGDIGFSAAEVKALAAENQIPDIDASGDPSERPALPSDRFRNPFANELQARAANGGALPPDLSVIVKAREHGADYIYALLTGYSDIIPAGMKITNGKYYNKYFAGNEISMPPPLSDNIVEYSDGTAATLDQEARDITNFLSWAAEPKLEERHQLGFKVMAFLLILIIFSYLSYRRISKRIKGD